ncbi:MAG TPA: hypothetical protein VFQ54_13705, partial [Thermomicrobiales bacterium]|nr:hypothetical protein [Thermomicrobiales bacterium]
NARQDRSDSPQMRDRTILVIARYVGRMRLQGDVIPFPSRRPMRSPPRGMTQLNEKSQGSV